MASLVHQFQKDIAQSTKSVTELLRSAKMIAVKLSLGDITEWVNAELGGYKDAIQLPEYRKIKGGTLEIFHPYRGVWQQIATLDREFPVRQQISEIEELCNVDSIVISLTIKDNYPVRIEFGEDVSDWQQQISIASVQERIFCVFPKR